MCHNPWPGKCPAHCPSAPQLRDFYANAVTHNAASICLWIRIKQRQKVVVVSLLVRMSWLMSDNCCRIPVAICKLCKNSQILWSLAHYQMQSSDVQVISSAWLSGGERRGNLPTLNSTFIFRFFIQQRIFNFSNYGRCKRTYLRTSCNRFYLTIGAKLGWFPTIIAHLIIVVKIVPSSLSTCQINQGICGRVSSCRGWVM